MPSPVNKAVLLHINAFIAENNIRRPVGSFAINAQSANGEVATRDTNVLPNANFSYTSILGNGITFIRCTRPLNAQFTTPSGTFEALIQSAMLITSPITSVVFSNADLVNSSQLTIVQA